MSRVSFRTKGGKLVSFMAKGTKRKARTLIPRKRRVKRKAKTMVKRRSRVRRVYARARRAYSTENRLMRGILPVRGPIGKAIAGVGVATLQEKFLPQVIPYQSVAAGFIVGGIPGAAGAFIKQMLVGGNEAGIGPGGNGY